ncbi:hypothetical protein HJC23_010761 [Cyclotella cryptica]|uniref:CBF1-interacting co-repressor CIR N-terminal domain-containing protein n=1 Tax=Cyclotella cryptica TaxID=29204 RepID=A0ABD3PXE3_9STRA|eukprot:CCRYP_011106-RA/>CCRYP_011106-RA protein AED:0.00 eAED:0.00 QI:65/-1/1/1/-1/1/1/76/450
MGGGLAFLTKKSFNPANWSNQRQVWEARQKHAAEQRRISEREAQLKREREEEDMARLMGGEQEGGRKALGFMYEGGRIPGLKRDDGKKVENEFGSESIVGGEGGKSASLYERQPGDDDAAAAFRAMLAQGNAPAKDVGSAAEANAASTTEPTEEEKAAATTEGRDHRTNLEKAVGRGINAGSGVTLAQQMERFPMLKGAPMVLQKPKDAADDKDQPTDVAGLNFKPLGQVLRNVKCLSCGKWGHSRGDRECEVSGWDPFRISAPAAPAKVDNISANVTKPVEKPLQTNEPTMHSEDSVHKSDRKKHSRSKKEKRRHKERRREERKRKHKRRRHRSSSYSSDSDSDSSSYNSRDRHGDRRNRHRPASIALYDTDSGSDRREHRSSNKRKSRQHFSDHHNRSSRRHKSRRRERSRSRSPSSYSADEKRSYAHKKHCSEDSRGEMKNRVQDKR